jgi:FkbM family methyltransferase
MTMVPMVHTLGAAGLWLYICKKLHTIKLPLELPVFGRVSSQHEIRNIFDNFGTGQLRDEVVEKYIARKSSPCIIDCGVNVGVTVRWWLYLNRSARVYGVDMMQEAHDFTAEALRSVKAPEGGYRPVTAAIWSEGGRELKFGVTDPLYGDYGFYRKDREETERTVITRTLDEIALSESIGEVDLLKVDLEGAAADALAGARELLKRTRHAVFEAHNVHNSRERALASDILQKSGFRLRRTAGRHLWWEAAK